VVVAKRAYVCGRLRPWLPPRARHQVRSAADDLVFARRMGGRVPVVRWSTGGEQVDAWQRTVGSTPALVVLSSRFCARPAIALSTRSETAPLLAEANA